MKHKALIIKNGKLKEVDLKSDNLLDAIDEMEQKTKRRRKNDKM
jgi:hypothetical protein